MATMDMPPTPALRMDTMAQGISITVFSWELVPGRTGVIVTAGVATDLMAVMAAAIMADPIAADPVPVDRPMVAGLVSVDRLPTADRQAAADPVPADRRAVAETGPAVAEIGPAAVVADRRVVAEIGLAAVVAGGRQMAAASITSRSLFIG